MKLISLNVALFEPNNQALADFFNEENADILALQEVTRRLDPEAQAAFVSKDTIDAAAPALTHQFFAPVMMARDFNTPHFHGHDYFAMDFGGFMDFGEYLKSKYPIPSGKNVFLENQYSLITDWASWPKVEHRAVQVTNIITPHSKPLRVINYHGFWSKDKIDQPRTLAASHTILALAQEAHSPVIICGDFNLFPETESIKLLASQFTNLVDSYNIHTTRPASNELHHSKRNVVDYIFVSPEV
jgi:endonuclease/exonuclease/phosphatase family metal-dependent hydrolase